jgi:hypothetical protein
MSCVDFAISCLLLRGKVSSENQISDPCPSSSIIEAKVPGKEQRQSGMLQIPGRVGDVFFVGILNAGRMMRVVRKAIRPRHFPPYSTQGSGSYSSTQRTAPD